MADGVREDEIAVGEALHQRAGAEAVRTVVGEVGLPDDEQAGKVAHQIVIHPQAAHRVMHRRINAHRCLIRVLAGDLFIHVEEVAVAFADFVVAQTFDSVGEIKINTETARPNASPLIANLLRRARSDVARGEVAIAGILAFEEIIAVRLGNPARRL